MKIQVIACIPFDRSSTHLPILPSTLPLPIHRPIHGSTMDPSIHPPIHPPTHPPIHPSTHPPTHPLIHHPPPHPPIHPVRVSVDEFAKNGIKDLGLPYLSDTRHPPDIFHAFESDFRFYEDDCGGPEEWLSTAAHKNFDSRPFLQGKAQKTLVVDDEVIETCADGQPKEETKKRKTEEAPAWTTDNAAEPSAGHTRALGAWEFASHADSILVRTTQRWSSHKSSRVW